MWWMQLIGEALRIAAHINQAFKICGTQPRWLVLQRVPEQRPATLRPRHGDVDAFHHPPPGNVVHRALDGHCVSTRTSYIC